MIKPRTRALAVRDLSATQEFFLRAMAVLIVLFGLAGAGRDLAALATQKQLPESYIQKISGFVSMPVVHAAPELSVHPATQLLPTKEVGLNSEIYVKARYVARGISVRFLSETGYPASVTGMHFRDKNGHSRSLGSDQSSPQVIPFSAVSNGQVKISFDGSTFWQRVPVRGAEY